MLPAAKCTLETYRVRAYPAHNQDLVEGNVNSICGIAMRRVINSNAHSKLIGSPNFDRDAVLVNTKLANARFLIENCEIAH